MYLKLCKRCYCLVESNQTGTRICISKPVWEPHYPGGIRGQLKNMVLPTG